MHQIKGLPNFDLPGRLYRPLLIKMPERVTEFNYDSMSRWLIDGLSAEELRRQAEPIMEKPVVQYGINAEDYYGKNLKAKFSDDFALRLSEAVTYAPRREVPVQGDDWYILTVLKSGLYCGTVGDTRFHLKGGTCGLFHHKSDVYFSTYPKIPSSGISVDIHFRPQVLANKLGISTKALSRLLHPRNHLTPSPYFSWCLTTPRMMDIFEELQSRSMDPATFKMFAECKALELMSNYLLAMEQQAEHCGEKGFPGHSGLEQLNRAKLILEENYQDPPDLDDLCRSVGLSRSRLTRGFKSWFGETVYEYLLRYRMQKAKHLLQNQLLNVGVVAELVGYNDADSFRRVFQRHVGVLPSQYRTNLEKTR